MSLDLIRLKILICDGGTVGDDDETWDDALEVLEREHVDHQIEAAVQGILARYHGLRGFTARVQEINE